MTYNFDMERLLDTFDGDPEKLANAFADALNEKLAERRKVDNINELANEVSENWECLVDEYFSAHPDELPKEYNPADFYISGDIAVGVLKTLIKLLPYLGLLAQYSEKMETLNKELVKYATNTATDKAADFEDAMKKFFDKNHI